MSGIRLIFMLLTIPALIMLGVWLWQRHQRLKYDSIRTRLRYQKMDDDTPFQEDFRAELPSGGARVVSIRDPLDIESVNQRIRAQAQANRPKLTIPMRGQPMQESLLLDEGAPSAPSQRSDADIPMLLDPADDMALKATRRQPEPEPLVVLQPEPEPELEPWAEPEPEPEPWAEPEPEPELQPLPWAEPEPELEPVAEVVPEPEPEPEPIFVPEPVFVPEPAPIFVPEPVRVLEPEPEAEPEPVREPIPQPDHDILFAAPETTEPNRWKSQRVDPVISAEVERTPTAPEPPRTPPEPPRAPPEEVPPPKAEEIPPAEVVDEPFELRPSNTDQPARKKKSSAARDLWDRTRRNVAEQVQNSPAAAKPAERSAQRAAPTAEPAPVPPEEVIIINLMVRDEGSHFIGEAVREALLHAGLQQGEMDIFHLKEQKDGKHLNFSVANILNPGTFPRQDWDAFSTPGICFFMMLGSQSANLATFDRMMAAARFTASYLGGDLRDQNRSYLTGQTVEHLRSGIADYQRRLLLR